MGADVDDGRTVLSGSRAAALLAAEVTLLRKGFTYEGGEEWRPPIGKAPAFSAPELLDAAVCHMRHRAATYDQPAGERSMGRTVAAFNVITGRDLSESEGWLLLQLLKDVRDRQGGQPHRDSLEDCIAYAALKAEARLAEFNTTEGKPCN